MRALTLHAPQQLRVEVVPDPVLETPDDAIVRVTRTAICGSDLHPYHGRERGLEPGTTMGHEFVGEVVELGPDASARGLRTGSRVMSPFTTSCGECYYCARGLTCRCEQGQLFGWRCSETGHGLHGAQAEFVRVPLASSTLVEIPDTVTDNEALLAGDVLATGTHCAERSGATNDDIVAVLGCGPVGLMAIRSLRSHGAATFAVDSIESRLQFAESLGATPVEIDDAKDVMAAATGGRGADVVLEVVGSPLASRLAIDLVRPGGTISAAGVHTEDRFAFSPGEVYDKNLTYTAGRCPARAYAEPLLSALADPDRPAYSSPARMITHEMSLEDGPSGYEVFDQKRDGCIKIVLVP